MVGRAARACSWTLVAAGLALLATALVSCAGAEILVCSRAGLERGELWRLLTGPLVHCTGGHVARELAPLLVVGLIYEPVLRSRYRLALVLTSVLPPLAAFSGADWMGAYYGLSGTVYGVLAAALAREWLRPRALGLSRALAPHSGAASPPRARRLPPLWVVAMTGVLAVKLAIEGITGALLVPATLPADVHPVPVAHLAGAAIGVLCAAPAGWLWRRARRAMPLLLLPALIWTQPAHAAASNPSVVAVLDVELGRLHLSAAVRALLRDYITAYLTESGRFQTVPDAKLRAAVVRLKKRSYADSYERSSQVAIGREVAAQKCLATRVTRVGPGCIVTVTLLDLRRATAQRSATAKGRCSEQAIAASLRRGVRRLTREPLYDEPEQPVGPISEAALRYHQGCHAGEAAACRRLGWLYQVGQGLPRDPTRAAAFYRRGCLDSDALSCSNLGFLHSKGDGLPIDDARAAAYYRLACVQGSAIGCNNLGDLHEHGRGVARDIERAVTLYRWACSAGFAPACSAAR